LGRGNFNPFLAVRRTSDPKKEKCIVKWSPVLSAYELLKADGLDWSSMTTSIKPSKQPVLQTNQEQSCSAFILL
jgi:hypothetical protein